MADTFSQTEEELENLIDHGYKSGNRVGAEDAIGFCVEFVEKLATVFFLERNDAQASLLRSVAQQMKEDAKKHLGIGV